MLNQAFTQQPHQNADRSTTMWSQPSTPAQKAYYSTHAAKRRVYGIIMTVLQFLHGCLAFAAWAAIITWAIGRVIDVPWLYQVLAVVALVTFHSLFRVTWMTYWYDRLDDNTETDSSFVIPVMILCILLYTESRGAKIFLENQVKPVVEISSVEADKKHQTYTSQIDAQEEKAKAASTAAYKSKIAAVALPFDNKIAQLRRKKAASEADAKYIRSMIRSKEIDRDAAIANIKNAQADDQLAITTRFATQRGQTDEMVQTERSKVTSHNSREQSRFDDDMSAVEKYAWLISAILLALICLLGYAQVRINVNSGILPLRTYTVLDAHGGVAERIWTALSDIFNRRTLQFAVWLHKIGSPKKALTSFDGTVVARPGAYNTHADFYGDTTPPRLAAPHDITDEDARQRVALKVMEHIRNNPGFVPTASQLDGEIALAKRMNGSYMSLPFASTTTPRANTAHTVTQQPITVTQQNTQILPMSCDDVMQFHLTDLQREPSNFSNSEATPATVMDRVVKKMIKAYTALEPMKKGDVSPDLCYKFQKFLFNKLFPHLKGEEYAEIEFDRLDKVIERLYDRKEADA